MSIFCSSCSSPGEKPLHPPPPPTPFYGRKGPLTCLLLPAIALFSSHFRWKWQYSVKRKFLRQSLAQLWRKGKHVFPLPHARRDLWGLDPHQGEESLIPPIPPARTGMAPSTFHQEDFLLSSSQSQPQVGANREELQDCLLSPASLHWVLGDPGGLVAHQAPLWSLMHTWAVCFVWPLRCQDYPELTGTQATYTWLLSLSTAAPGWSWRQQAGFGSPGSWHQPAGVGLSPPSLPAASWGLSFASLRNNPASMHFPCLMKGGFIAPALWERRGLLPSLFSFLRPFKYSLCEN